MYIKKKAYLWPKRRDWRRLGPFSLCGPSLAVVGCCGPSWACVGLRWPSLASVGLPGPALAFVGRCWLLWAFLGLVVIKKFKMQGTGKVEWVPSRSQAQGNGREWMLSSP